MNDDDDDDDNDVVSSIPASLSYFHP